jgi:hypothetical protein
VSEPLADVCCARLRAADLAHLGALRAHADLRALFRDGELWLFWPAGDADLARALLAIGGCALYASAGGVWRRPGASLPAFDVPDAAGARPLSSVLFPAPVTAVAPGGESWRRATLQLVRDGPPRPATALRAARADILRWADTATTHQLEALRACWCGEDVLLLGAPLPALPGERFWGSRVLLPLGRRPEPELAEPVLAGALRLREGEVALWTAAGVEVLSADAAGPVTRAGLRLTAGPRSTRRGRE